MNDNSPRTEDYDMVVLGSAQVLPSRSRATRSSLIQPYWRVPLPFLRMFHLRPKRKAPRDKHIGPQAMRTLNQPVLNRGRAKSK